MIPPEEACGHEVGHHHVDGVVIMSQQDAEDTDGTQAPADPVIPPEPPWRICTKKNLYNSFKVQADIPNTNIINGFKYLCAMYNMF